MERVFRSILCNMRQSIARLSRFDKGFLPVENTLDFLRAARKRLGKPSRILKNEKNHEYWFGHFMGFDYITIVIDRKKAA